MNSVTDRPYRSIPDFECRDQESADMVWNYHIERNKSPLIDFFYGQMATEINCPICHRVCLVEHYWNCRFLSILIPSIAIPWVFHRRRSPLLWIFSILIWNIWLLSASLCPSTSKKRILQVSFMTLCSNTILFQALKWSYWRLLWAVMMMILQYIHSELLDSLSSMSIWRKRIPFLQSVPMIRRLIYWFILYDILGVMIQYIVGKRV